MAALVAGKKKRLGHPGRFHVASCRLSIRHNSTAVRQRSAARSPVVAMAEMGADGLARQFQCLLALVTNQVLAGWAYQCHGQQLATGQWQDEQDGEQALHSGCLVTG